MSLLAGDDYEQYRIHSLGVTVWTEREVPEPKLAVLSLFGILACAFFRSARA